MLSFFASIIVDAFLRFRPFRLLTLFISRFDMPMTLIVAIHAR